MQWQLHLVDRLPERLPARVPHRLHVAPARQFDASKAHLRHATDLLHREINAAKGRQAVSFSLDTVPSTP